MTALTPLRLVRYAGQAIQRARVMAQASREQDVPMMEDLPRVSFNGQIGPRRNFALREGPAPDHPRRERSTST